MNTTGSRQTLVITLAMMAALTVGSSMAFAQASTPRIQANTTLALPDGSVLELTSRFRFDVDTNESGITTTTNEAVLEAEIAHPPNPCVVNPSPGAHPPGPCRYRIQGESPASTAQPSMLIALLLLAHGYVSPSQIVQTLGYPVIITRASCPGGCGKLPSDNTVFGQLFAQVSAVDPSGSVAVARLLNQVGILLYPPGPPGVPGSL